MRKSVLALIALGLALGGCAAEGFAEPPAGDKPANVEAIAGSSLKKITLAEKASQRLGIKTAAVATSTVDGQQLTTVPYGALLYDPAGKTWVYTNPQPLVFVRHEVTVVRIAKDIVLLSAGPPAGTQVVTVGVAELYGAEVGVGK
uniref:Lipoprotein n=1 Tax=uncultured bacterium esnapd14 TaxID=1366594 RepID=S5TMY0_9BACT|nr:hypothetical protein [uncultured bacterium esnapd14]